MDFDKETGDYRILLTAYVSAPFVGDFRVNVNLFNPDVGTTQRDPSFFTDTFNEFSLPSATTTITLVGNNPRLRAWDSGDRVFTNSLRGTGNPDGISLFRSSVSNPPFFFLRNQDVIAFRDWAQAAIVAEAAVLAVDIDIKPNSNPNSILCTNTDGLIAVAILTTYDVDALTIDSETVTLNGAREHHVNRHTGAPRRHEEDVDHDGDLDLVFHFRLGDSDLTCNSVSGIVCGETVAGELIRGEDPVRMIGGETSSWSSRGQTSP